MFPTLRHSLTWAHRWIGLLFGAVLFAIFFFGSLSLFDSEIDRWMQPATRIAAPADPISIDALMPRLREAIGGEPTWTIKLPSPRDGRLQLRASGGKGKPVAADFDPEHMTRLPKLATSGATGLFLPFHYSLLIAWAQIGYWIVAFVAIAALVMLISGVVIHVRLIANLFTYRPAAAPRRRLLDLHNLLGVSTLPFTAMIVLSGLLVSYSNINPAGIRTAYGGNRQHFFDEVFGNYKRPPAGRPAALAPLDPIVAAASRAWGGGQPDLIQVYNDGDANAYVGLRRRNDERVTADPQLIYFDGVTGTLLKFAPLHSGIATQRWLTGLHMIQFNRWLLRWLYFALGLMGCGMIATGLLAWVARTRPSGDRTRADAFALAVITGPLLATLAYLVGNRLLPAAMPGRALDELRLFFGAWALAVIHAFIRSGAFDQHRAAGEQCWAAALLALLAPLLNWVTTGDHPLRLFSGETPAVTAVDLFLLALAAAAALIGWRLHSPRKERPA